jgi:serine/threonine protein phosphatase 1
MTVSIEIGNWLPAPALALQPAFAIGDVHGRDDLCGPLIEAIERVVLEDRLRDAVLVPLGDYIDRGPNGISALNRALDGSDNTVLTVHPLPGNHEVFLRSFLDSEGYRRRAVREYWFNNGGKAVARELGFEPDRMFMRTVTFVRAIKRAIGEERLERFYAMQNHVRIGKYLFVHAGIHPDLGLATLHREWGTLPSSSAEQDKDPLWIRGPFLTYEGAHEDGVVVVHGHTTRPQVELCANRINCDTRAYESGRLTAVQLLGSKLRVIQSIGPSGPSLRLASNY